MGVNIYYAHVFSIYFMFIAHLLIHSSARAVKSNSDLSQNSLLNCRCWGKNKTRQPNQQLRPLNVWKKWRIDRFIRAQNAPKQFSILEIILCSAKRWREDSFCEYNEPIQNKTNFAIVLFFSGIFSLQERMPESPLSKKYWERIRVRDKPVNFLACDSILISLIVEIEIKAS